MKRYFQGGHIRLHFWEKNCSVYPICAETISSALKKFFLQIVDRRIGLHNLNFKEWFGQKLNLQ